MFCNKCGTQVPDNTLFCPNCGNPMMQEKAPEAPEAQNETTGEVYGAAAFQQPAYYQPQAMNPYENDPQASADASQVLKWGIIGIAFASSFFLSFLGIIFSAIGISKANAFIAKYGMVWKKSKVGRILARVGLPLGIGLTVLFILYLIFVVWAISSVTYYW